jgi:hypothetical protein
MTVTTPPRAAATAMDGSARPAIDAPQLRRYRQGTRAAGYHGMPTKIAKCPTFGSMM